MSSTGCWRASYTGEQKALRFLKVFLEKSNETVSFAAEQTGLVLFSAESVRNDVASLGSTGVFSQISPSFSEIPEGVQLDYKLVSNPVVHHVEFTGIPFLLMNI